jgi:hypothetical protein
MEPARAARGVRGAGRPSVAEVRGSAARHARHRARPRYAAITVNEGRGYFTRLRKLAVQEAGGAKLIVDPETRDVALFDLEVGSGRDKNLIGSRTAGGEAG